MRILARGPTTRTAPSGGLVQAEPEGSDDTEIAAAAADRPEQVGVLIGRGPQHPPVSGDDLGGEQVVDAQPELAGQPAHAAAEGEPPDAGVADQPGGRSEPVGLGSRIQICQQRPTADPRGPGRRIDNGRVQQAQVDHQAAIPDGGAGRVMRTSAHRYLEPGAAREADRRNHIGSRSAAGDHRRRRSIPAFHTRRLASKSGSPGAITGPLMARRSSSMPRLVVGVMAVLPSWSPQMTRMKLSPTAASRCRRQPQLTSAACRRLAGLWRSRGGADLTDFMLVLATVDRASQPSVVELAEHRRHLSRLIRPAAITGSLGAERPIPAPCRTGRCRASACQPASPPWRSR